MCVSNCANGFTNLSSCFFLDNFDAVSKKEKKRMRLIWSCAPVFSLFYLTLNLWVGLIGPKYVNTTQNEHPVSKEARGYLIFFCSFEARGLLSTNSSLSKNHVLSISALNFFLPWLKILSLKIIYTWKIIVHILELFRGPCL